MKHLSQQSNLQFFPPPDSEGRPCAEVQANTSQVFSYRKNMMGPTWALLQNHSPPSGSVRPPIMNNQHFTIPVPAVPAVDEFLNAPPIGPSIRGKTFATSRLTCRSLSFHVSHVNCGRDVASFSFPVVPLCRIPHAPIRPYCTLGGPVHRRPHRSPHRTNRVRLSGSAIN